jgi:hypothetical protein
MTQFIQHYTKDPYNHISIAFDEKLQYTYSFGRMKSDNPFMGGFVHEQLNKGVFEDAICKVVSLDINPSQYEILHQRIEKMQEEQTKYSYNFIGLFGLHYNFDLNKRYIKREYSLFCSQFVASLLQEAELFPQSLLPQLLKPADILDYVEAKTEYEGKLSGYLQRIDFQELQNVHNSISLRRQIIYFPIDLLLRGLI